MTCRSFVDRGGWQPPLPSVCKLPWLAARPCLLPTLLLVQAREAAGPSFAEVQMGEHQPAPVDQGGVSTVQAAAGCDDSLRMERSRAACCRVQLGPAGLVPLCSCFLRLHAACRLLPPSCVVAGSGRREPARGNGAVAEAEPRVLTAAELQQHLLALLRAEHKLECPAREAPAPAGLLDLLTQDGAWELLSAHRSGEASSGCARGSQMMQHGRRWAALASCPLPPPVTLRLSPLCMPSSQGREQPAPSRPAQLLRHQVPGKGCATHRS
jgi:hypothetical protein